MRYLLKMERYQLFRNRIYWFGMTAIFLLGFLTAETYVSEVMGPLEKTAVSLADILDGMVYDSTFLLIIISCLIAFTIGQEFTCRTVSREVSGGCSRFQVFFSKVTVYLLAFHLMALVYPIAGCIREFSRFGLPDAPFFFLHLLKAVLYSLVLNTCIFLIPVLFCFYFRDTAKAVAVTTLTTFSLSLYLGYGMMLELPTRFLPTFQIRKLLLSPGFFTWESLLVTLAWCGILLPGIWLLFRKCELK